MANRSDFFNSTPASPKLPRYLKKMLALNGGTPEIRRMFTQAHLVHVAYKLKRESKDAVDTSEAE